MSSTLTVVVRLGCPESPQTMSTASAEYSITVVVTVASFWPSMALSDVLVVRALESWHSTTRMYGRTNSVAAVHGDLGAGQQVFDVRDLRVEVTVVLDGDRARDVVTAVLEPVVGHVDGPGGGFVAAAVGVEPDLRQLVVDVVVLGLDFLVDGPEVLAVISRIDRLRDREVLLVLLHRDAGANMRELRFPPSTSVDAFSSVSSPGVTIHQCRASAGVG